MKKILFSLIVVISVAGLLLFKQYHKIDFTYSDLKGVEHLYNPTSLQFGPDDRLYVARQNGLILVYTIEKKGPGNYHVTDTEIIDLVKKIPNHYDNGELRPYDPAKNTRQVTGLLVTGTSEVPVLYVSSSDPLIGGPGGDVNLCTNSGIISRLTRTDGKWEKVDIVRGIPRSEENHSVNGMAYDSLKNQLYVAVGGMTNAGGPSYNFTFSTEYAMAACILSIDLNRIDTMPVKGLQTDDPYVYDLPTLNDPEREDLPDGSDINDPFGGNDGLNQAKIDPAGPVQVYASGFRNPYDVLITSGRKLYTVDNGANPGWGGFPDNDGMDGKVTNNYPAGEPGSLGPGVNKPIINNLDGLHFIGEIDNYNCGSYYGGHPCPVRANPKGAGLYTHKGNNDSGKGVWRTTISDDKESTLPADWPPVPDAKPEEGEFLHPGSANSPALLTFRMSVNGICEYRASCFNGALKGDILAAGLGSKGPVFRIRLDESGRNVRNLKGKERLNHDKPLATGLASKPLDITTQGDHQIFPGTIWLAVFGENKITVLEPGEFSLFGNKHKKSDHDGDCYSHKDEADNGTDPYSAASKPMDFNKNCISDLNDPDDDSDGIKDEADPFARDATNGMNVFPPLNYEFFNDHPGSGFFGLGFTGLMYNGKTDYLMQYNESSIIAGGAIGAITINEVDQGDASGKLNSQTNAFQFGMNVSDTTSPFLVKCRLIGKPFGGIVPKGEMSQGFYIGTGDQDNYVKIALHANEGKGGIQIVVENDGKPESVIKPVSEMPRSSLDLIFRINPASKTIKASFIVDDKKEVEASAEIELPEKIKSCFSKDKALAIGIIATSRGGKPYKATWDFIRVEYLGSNNDQKHSIH
ncbi:MAG: hypothetical protein ACK40G_11865 [Cytophagaceae bacterium]